MALERRGIQGAVQGRAAPRTSRGDERPLGQAVARVEGLAPEAAWAERLDEALERVHANGLGAAEGDLPTAQVQGGPLLGGNAAHAQVEGEVGASADGAPEARDRLQPPHRRLEEAQTRKQRGG